MDETLAHLQRLDLREVWASLRRSKDGGGAPVIRRGTFRLFDAAAPGEAPCTRVVDADGLTLVRLLAADTLALVDGGVLRVMLHATFHIELSAEPFVFAVGPNGPITYDLAARTLTAELEAAFRSALRVRPDPDPGEPGPLVDDSLRFAVGHQSATLLPDGDDALRLTCIGSSMRDGRRFADLFEPAGGARYAFAGDDLVRLGSDARAFLSGRRERFVAYSGRR